MNKQEVIRKAYGKRHEDLKDFINVHGVFVGDTDSITDQEFKDWDFIASTPPINGGKLVSGSRPKSLQGIENNNGWIKIESESDYPKPGQYWVIDDDGDMFITDMELFENEFDWSVIEYYQPITKPLKPIY